MSNQNVQSMGSSAALEDSITVEIDPHKTPLGYDLHHVRVDYPLTFTQGNEITYQIGKCPISYTLFVSWTYTRDNNTGVCSFHHFVFSAKGDVTEWIKETILKVGSN